MTVEDAIKRIKNNIADTYAIAEGKGATLPEVQNSNNLAECVSTIKIGSENVIEIIEYDGEELVPVNKKVSIPGYKIIKENIPASGMAATYSLYKGETSTGNTINIPLDVRLTNVQCKICEKKDTPEEGFNKGNWYLDFTIENAEKNHIYVNLKDISTGVYSQGTGIIIENNQIRIDDTIVVTHDQLNAENFITYEIIVSK